MTGPDVVVLALPRGGVPVAVEVAQALHAPLDIFTVRKLGVPGHEELAMGAIASGGLMVLVDDVVRGLAIAPDVIQACRRAGGARAAAPRDDVPRGPSPCSTSPAAPSSWSTTGWPPAPACRPRCRRCARLRPAEIVVAVPAAPESTTRDLAALADTVVCAATPTPFLAVGAAYWDFDQTSDTEVRDLLRAAATGTTPPALRRRRRSRPTTSP